MSVDRYRKLPIPVEARQVPPSKDGQSGLDLAAWCGGSVSGTYAEPKIFVPTLEGDLVARVGDWIVKGPQGEFWPVKGDIFAETYERVTEVSRAGSARERLERICGPQTPPELIADLDAYRAEVLAADGQAYDGELAMYRGLIRTFRAVTRPDDADMGEVRRLLHHHAADDATARTENATAAEAPATPDFFEPGHSYSHRNGWNDFHCVAITAHPTTGQRLAMGWLSERGEWHRPTVCNLGQWLHEYDGVQPPTSTQEDGQ